MSDLENWLFGAMLAGLMIGLWAVLGLRCGARRQRYWFRTLYVVALLILGAGCAAAALYCPSALLPLGLAAGGLAVIVLWEGPPAAWPGAPPAADE